MQCRAVSGRAGVGKGEGVQGPARRAFLPLVLGHLGVLGMWLSQAFRDLTLAQPALCETMALSLGYGCCHHY